MKRHLLVSALILIAGSLFCRAALAQEVRAAVDRTQISLDESIRLTVTIVDGQGEVDPGPIEDFKVFPEGTSTSIRIVNGHTSRETAINYTLMPLRDGRLRVPPLAVTVDGRVHQTHEITVQVSRQAPPADSQRDIFVTAHVSKQNPYMGESVTFFLRLFHAVRIADPSVQELPTFDGFSAKPLENQEGYRKVVNGKQYLVRELIFVLSPLAAGEHIITPALITLDVYQARQGSRRGALDRIFDDPFFSGGRRQNLRLRTDPVPVTVRSLPPDTPVSVLFSGLVGRFEIKSTLEKRQLAAGDATTLVVTISGRGNLMDAEPPDIHIPKGLKTYSDTPEEDIQLTPEGYSGKKTFRIALVGIQPGTYPIGPVSVRYFNLETERYETLATDISTITVTPSGERDTFKVTSDDRPDAAPTASKTRVEFTGRDILPIKENLNALTPQGQVGLAQFILLLLAPFLVCLAAWGWRRATRPTEDPATLMAKRAKEALKAAERGPEDTFLANLSRALIFAILSRAGIKGESLTYREAEDTLRSTGLDPELARKAGALLDRIDSTRYGGRRLDVQAQATLRHETRSMIRQVMKS